jgi:hypothetical protein
MEKLSASWPGVCTPALFLNGPSGWQCTRSVSRLLTGLAAADLVHGDGKPEASAHDIQHTFATSILRANRRRTAAHRVRQRSPLGPLVSGAGDVILVIGAQKIVPDVATGDAAYL